jgi:hypothetical protein
MQMPVSAQALRLFTLIGTVLSCLMGAGLILAGLPAFQFGVLSGVLAILPGAWWVLGSLAVLGAVYCFLALVEAQIDARNAIVAYTARAGAANNPSAQGSGQPRHFIG